MKNSAKVKNDFQSNSQYFLFSHIFIVLVSMTLFFCCLGSSPCTISESNSSKYGDPFKYDVILILNFLIFSIVHAFNQANLKKKDKVKINLFHCNA